MRLLGRLSPDEQRRRWVEGMEHESLRRARERHGGDLTNEQRHLALWEGQITAEAV
ncbi:hypothetical protein SAMN06264364_14927 [Quadrisphaera granulorum]|uniref:Uncharacterized protein n=1 Tax=Quadrisphaera granulorum TaxID=317664 RepID=A0A315ZL72_9ACTN|nr:hypothetical protein BXY45_14927 [Quadrisphaera granulorum]SZE99106.1 hypothetical protein SAMN06264364_14927 [Quadrisphaera granulorum]